MKSSVLITGTSRGIGLELVKQLAKTEWCGSIFATARCETDALKEVIKTNSNVRFIKLDVLDEASIRSAAKEVSQSLGPTRGLNYLINNAGIMDRSTLEESNSQNINKILSTNVTAPTIILKEFLSLLERSQQCNERSLVVNCSSIMSSFVHTTTDGVYLYRVSKTALNMLSHTMNLYLAPRNIHVVALHPGWVQTDMGGPQAPLTVEESVSRTLVVLRDCKAEYFGKLVDYNGTILDW